ncbi:MAG: hypothetical protein ABL934_03080 [Lysobacteraceae bacterium]
MTHAVPFFTSALIAAQVAAAQSAVFMIFPTPIAFEPTEPLPYWADAPKSVTVSLMTPEGGLLPADAACDVYKVNSAGTAQLFARLSSSRPVVRIDGVGGYFVEKLPTATPVGVDIDGPSSSATSSD